MSVRDTLAELVAELSAAGVRATLDPADAHPPVVWVAPARAERAGAPGCWLVECEARFLVPPAADPVWPWGSVLDQLAGVMPVDAVLADQQLPDGTPYVAVTFTLTTR